MNRFSCPKCKTVLQASSEQVGKTIACPKCRSQMKIPSPASQQRPAPACPPTQSAEPPPVPLDAGQGWYYAKGGLKIGPVTEADLKALARTGELARNDMVWRAGMDKWAAAHSVPGLLPAAATAPPPPPLPGPQEDRESLSFEQKAGLAVAAACGLLGLFCPVGALALGTNFWIFSPLFLAAAPLVLVLWVFNGWAIKGRWVPVDGTRGWVEFHRGGIFKQEDGMVGTFVLLRNKKYIDILVSGRLVETWKILSWGMNTLEVQDGSDTTRSFKRGKTLEQKQANPFYEDRSRCLWHKWEPVDGSGPAVQFTEDGAMIRFDGFAARYTFSGEEPNEVITIYVDDKKKAELKVVSLGRDELVLAGEGGSCHYKRGVSISDAEAKRRADAFNEKLKTVGKAALITVGAIGAGIAVLGVAAAASNGNGAGGSFGSGTSSGPMATCDRCKMKIPLQSSVCPYCHATHKPNYY